MGVVGVMARRIVGSFCVLVGVALGYASISGSYRAWVSQSPVLIALSSVGLVMVGLTTACQREHCGCGDHDHRWAPGGLGFLGLFGFFFVDNAHGEANVDENPFTEKGLWVAIADKGNVDLALYAADIHSGEL